MKVNLQYRIINGNTADNVCSLVIFMVILTVYCLLKKTYTIVYSKR